MKIRSTKGTRATTTARTLQTLSLVRSTRHAAKVLAFCICFSLILSPTMIAIAATEANIKTEADVNAYTNAATTATVNPTIVHVPVSAADFTDVPFDAW